MRWEGEGSGGRKGDGSGGWQRAVEEGRERVEGGRERVVDVVRRKCVT